ncbi:MAG: hypothetical protein HOP29_05180 [Phycisphaerales bacterium]|nr:hypothetical protein [Phycisphaerales bacterium]
MPWSHRNRSRLLCAVCLLLASGTEAQVDLSEARELANDILAARAISGPTTQGGGGVLYVDGASTGPVHDGSTWCKAFVYLQDALTTAAGSGGAISEIRVAAGTHKPDRGAGQTPLNKNATFNLFSGISLKGGYAGCSAANPDARDFQTYQTILSGDLAGNDGPGFVNYGDNSCHIVRAWTVLNVALEGFTIQSAEGALCGAGGGILNAGSGLIVRSCVFRDNRAQAGSAVYNLATNAGFVDCQFVRNRSTAGNGGAIISQFSAARYTNCLFLDNETLSGRGGAIYSEMALLSLGPPKLVNCRFIGNSAPLSGGAIHNRSAAPILVNCLFSGNVTPGDGGALANVEGGDPADAVLVNCTFGGNSAGGSGGGIFNDGAVLSITHGIFWNNTDAGGSDESAQLHNVSDLPIVDYTCVQGWVGTLGGIDNFGANPLFANPAGVDAVVGTDDDDLRLLSNSPCIDVGNNARIGLDVTDLDADGNIAEGVPFDPEGSPRILDGDGNEELAGIPATIDLGAYEAGETPGPNPPRITAIHPAAGQWITDNVGLPTFAMTFDHNVSVPAGAVSARGAVAGPITGFTTSYDANTRTLAVAFDSAIRDDRVTIVLDFTTADSLGRALDGEIDNPSAAGLPSGDGVAGGQAVFRVNVLQGDANHDGIVDVFDRAIIRVALGSAIGGATYNALADLNSDGNVNALDVGIYSLAEGNTLPPGDGTTPYVTSITPDPLSGLSADLDAVTVHFSEPLVVGIGQRTCYLIDASGAIHVPATVDLAADGRSATYRYTPALPFCGDYSVRVSNAPGDATDTLLFTPSAAAVLSGLSAPPPAPVLDDPAPLLTDDTTITVNGSAQSGATIAVSGHGGVCGVIGQTACEISAGPDGTFSIDLTLAVNHVNHIFFSAISACNGLAGAPVTKIITHDTEDPFVYIDFPLNGDEITTATTDVAGRVADSMSGSMGLAVSVNGISAAVDDGIGTNGTFFRPTVPLVVGANLITVVATDALGNSAQHQVTVNRVMVDPDDPVITRDTVNSGNGQSAPVHALVANPIRVLVMDGDGTPFENKVVTFNVTRSDGLLNATPPMTANDGTRMLQVHTDAAGRASAYWRLGTDAGSGNNRVEVVSNGAAGTVVFCASATPGPVNQINIGSGNNQRAEVGADAPLPLRVWVSDGCNGIAGQPVKFQVIRGDGRVNAQNTVVVSTGQTGHVEVNLTLGFAPGNNTIEASLVEPPGTLPVKQPARFQAFGLARDQATTTFAGVVFSNGGQPIQNAQCILTVTGQFYAPILTDADGRFQFDNIVHYGAAFLYINGASATHVGGVECTTPEGIVAPCTFPFLTYDTIVVPNAANSLSTPVMLPPLDPRSRVPYDGTTDVVLQVMTEDPDNPGQSIVAIEGLKMLVKAGSVTLRDGVIPTPASPAYLSLNQVHEDDIPMPIPDGASPPFAWTVQPAGARFNPPIEITYPNMTGLAPGSIAYFLSFNHDTARFEIVASAHVTEDGSSIVSDPGDGLALAGWGCNCPPYSVTGDCCSGGCDDDCCDGTCCGCSCCPEKCCNGQCCHDCCGGECCDGECCEGVCCGPGEICCDGECFKGELCNGECCEGECCDGVCCSEGDTCCDGQCCAGPCCPETGECCPSTDKSCCDGECCGGPCCDATGECCPASDKSCCNNECCAGLCCNDVCCEAGDESCCNDSCCEGPCCQNNCCSSGESCCGPFCCAPGKSCCNSETGLCCDPGTMCCDGEDCCEPDEECCNGICCPPDQMCCNGMCRPVSCSFSVDPGHGCPGNTIQLELTGTCRPPCWSMSPAPEVQPQHATISVLGSIPCDNEPHAIYVSVAIHDDAPLGPISFTLVATAPNGTKCQSSGTVIVENINLAFDGLPEETEEDPGGVLCVNNDDDDFDGKADKLHPEQVEGEDDLKTLYLSLNGLPGGGTATLTGGGSRVRVYEGPEKVDLVTIPASFPSSELPKTLWVEGVQASSAARDVTFELRYTPPGGQLCKDKVKISVGEVEFTDTNAPEYTGSRYELMDLIKLYDRAPRVDITTGSVPSSGGAGVAPINGTIENPIAPVAQSDVTVNGEVVTTLSVTQWGPNNMGPFEQIFGKNMSLTDYDQLFKVDVKDVQGTHGWDKLVAIAEYQTSDAPPATPPNPYNYSGAFTGRASRPEDLTPTPTGENFSFRISVVDPLQEADMITVSLSTGVDATSIKLNREGSTIRFSNGPLYLVTESLVMPPGTPQDIIDTRAKGRLGRSLLAEYTLYSGPPCEDHALSVGGQFVDFVPPAGETPSDVITAGLPRDVGFGKTIRAVVGAPGDIPGLPTENGIPYLSGFVGGRDYRDFFINFDTSAVRFYRVDQNPGTPGYDLYKSSATKPLFPLASDKAGAPDPDPAGATLVEVEPGGFLHLDVGVAGVDVETIRPVRGAIIVNVLVDGLGAGFPQAGFAPAAPPNFQTLLSSLPNFKRLVGNGSRDISHYNGRTTFPSITFSAWSSWATGKDPNVHGVTGSNFFVRNLAADPFWMGSAEMDWPIEHVSFHGPFDPVQDLDASSVWHEIGTLNSSIRPGVPTLYEAMNDHGLLSAVVYHFVYRGATNRRHPSEFDGALFHHGGTGKADDLSGTRTSLLELMDPDPAMSLAHIRTPQVLTVYFPGLDNNVHNNPSYLTVGADHLRFNDRMLGSLVRILDQWNLLEGARFTITGDHGLTEVVKDDAHSIVIETSFDEELEDVFDSMSWDVLDLAAYSGKGDYNAVAALNGGIAHIYLRNRHNGNTSWAIPPDYALDVIPLAQRFYDMSVGLDVDGNKEDEILGALELVLMRDATGPEGFAAPYKIGFRYAGTEGSFVPISVPGGVGFDCNGAGMPLVPPAYVDFVANIDRLRDIRSGDIILLSNISKRHRNCVNPAITGQPYDGGHYFGDPLDSWHGSAYDTDMTIPIIFSFPGGEGQELDDFFNTVNASVPSQPGPARITDIVPTLYKLLTGENMP